MRYVVHVAHAPGWIDLYDVLERDGAPSAELVARCLANRNGIGETMLHWYAIEGSPEVLQRLVALGFDLDATDDSGDYPLFSAAFIARWDNVRVLRAAGARRSGVTQAGYSYRSVITSKWPQVPDDLRGDAYDLEDLLVPDGPEDREVMSLHLTRAGLPRGAPGAPLTAATWRAWAERQRLDLDDAPFCEAEPDLELDARVEFWSPDRAARRLVHAAAQHFGARVVWEFCASDEPEA